MGDYTQVEVDVRIKPDKVNDLREALVNLKEESQKDIRHWFRYYDDITIGESDKDGDIHFNDYNRKWSCRDEFYEFLQDYAIDGSEIRGRGEDFGDVWVCSFEGGDFKIRKPIREER